MKAIYKYRLDTPRGGVMMPKGARLLSAAVQAQDSYSGIVVWAVVDPEAAQVLRRIIAINTGDPAPDNDVRFVATLVVHQIVWHIFDGGDP